MSQNLFAKIFLFMKRDPPADCRQIQALCFAYLEGELGPVEQTAVEQHLQNCAACRLELEQFRRSESALASARVSIPAPGDLRAGFYAKLAQSQPRRPVPAGWRVAVPALASAALLAVFARPWLFPGQPFHSVEPRGGVNMQANIQHGSRQKRDTAIVRTAPPTKIRLPAAHPNSVIASGSVRKARRHPADTHSYKLLAELPVHSRKRRASILLASGDTNSMLERKNLSRQPDTYALNEMAKSSLSAHGNNQIGRELLSAPAADQDSRVSRAKSAASEGEVTLTSFVSRTELHVSDENRDFMSSTHINGVLNARDRSEKVSVDDDNETTQQPVELPALP